ncbi:Peroxisomal membrane protein PMP34 [Pteropus alecto]|uniref:Peroxisomal membrane protein PMP34 n=1 Tax=Pteropus alecto TaxID=9402 RepID=L5KBX2_PTEAL|nr:Peroxisomal membrane protein PMP34 [Pteropus alecto]
MASVLSYENLVHAVAGAVGSVTAMTVFFPLDTARLRLQVDEKRKSKTTHMVLLEIIKEEGLLAPYRGWFPVISSLCCSNFVYFYTFNSLKAIWVKGQHSTTGKDLVVGFVAGVVNVLLTTPLWVVNTRLKLQGAKFRNEDIVPTNYRGIFDAFHQIVRDEGLLSLWNGTFPSLLLVFNPAIHFMFYEGLKRQLLKKRKKLSSLDVFIIGAVAKAVATIVTYPMQTVQSILRIVRDEGLLSLWNGTFPSLLLVFNPAIHFMFYEGLKRQLLKKRKKLSSLDVFIIGAVAKAIATIVTYPMQTVQSILRFGRHRLNPENRTLGSLRNILYLLHQRIRRFGIMGLYKGLEAKLLQTVLTAALMFLVYEKLTAATFTVMGLKNAHKH